MIETISPTKEVKIEMKDIQELGKAKVQEEKEVKNIYENIYETPFPAGEEEIQERMKFYNSLINK